LWSTSTAPIADVTGYYRHSNRWRQCSGCRRRPRCPQRLHRMRNPTPEFDGWPAQTSPSVHV